MEFSDPSGDIFSRPPDIAVWVCDGGLLIKHLRVEPHPKGGIDVSVSETIAGSEDMALAHFERIVAAELSARRKFDDLNGPGPQE